MNDGTLQQPTSPKRVRVGRRSWYRRRLRMQRIVMAVFVGTLLATACLLNAARYFQSSFSQSSQVSGSSWVKGSLQKNLASRVASLPRPAKWLMRIPGVYPYSVVPGGVKDLRDLREAAARDAVVRRHYARFDYDHARLVRASEAREVYLSYRIRDTVFWTRKKVRLHVGELLLTDGKITARAHCGNQISDTAKPEVSQEEPEDDVLDQPVAVMEAPSSPIRPVLAPSGLPPGQPMEPKIFTGGFLFPYVPMGIPISSSRCPFDSTLVDGHCEPRKHKKPVVPEPSTMVLIASGLALITWRYRKVAKPVTT
ncbi:MAG: PEP-CTERM sorting domain-containing protein [Terriglobales bacterium]